jgi:hypothetical protein
MLGILEFDIQEALLVVGLLQLLLEILNQVLRFPSPRIFELFGLGLGCGVIWCRSDRNVIDLFVLHWLLRRRVVHLNNLGVLLVHGGQ